MDSCRILSRWRWPITAILSCGLPVFAQTACAQQVPTGYREVATRHGVPSESLYTLALAETSLAPKSIATIIRSTVDQLPAVERPWPWTINVAGRGYRYASRLQAWNALQGFLQTYPRKRIDVGIAQVNMGWNGHHFVSTWEAFDPYINLNAAAAILRECYDRNPGSWLAAAGCYHHPAGGKPAARYKAIIKTKLAGIHGATPMAIASIPANSLTSQTTAFIWVEPRSQ